MTAVTQDRRDEMPERKESMESARTTRISASERAVLIGWALLTLLSLYAAVRFSTPMPYLDDWMNLTPVIAGKQPTVAWLMERHSDHRVTAVRLVMAAVLKLTGNRIESFIYLMVAIRSLLALMLIRTARRIRGRTRLSDLFFPLLWLNWGHTESLFWASMLGFLMPVGLMGVVLGVATTSAQRITVRDGAAAAVCLMVLPLCGGQGVIVTGALCLWWLYVFLFARDCLPASPSGRALLLILFALTLPALGTYLLKIGPSQAGYVAPAASLSVMVRTAFQFLATGMAPNLVERWYVPAAVTLLCMAVGIGFAARTWNRAPATRPALVGLLCFVAVGLAFVFAVGVKRAALMHNAGLDPRYTEYMAITLSALYLLHLLSPDRGAKPMPAIYCALLAVFSALSLKSSLVRLSAYHSELTGMQQDLAAGTPLYRCAERYNDLVVLGFIDFPQAALELKRAGFAPFAGAQPDPPFRETPVPEEWISRNGLARSSGLWQAADESAALRIRLPDRRRLVGVRFRFRQTDPATATGRWIVYWKRSDQPQFVAHDGPNRQFAQYHTFNAGPELQTRTVYMDDDVDEIELQPADRPTAFEMPEITLLQTDR